MGRSLVSKLNSPFLVALIGSGMLAGPATTFASKPTPTETTTLTFAAEADAYVEEADPGANHGEGDLLVDGSPAMESYLRFAVDGVNDTVERATLRIYAYDGSTDGPAVYGTSNSWAESVITWGNRPLPMGTVLDDRGEVEADAWIEYDVTPLVVGDGRYDFVLTPTSTDGVDFYGREHSSNGPQLKVAVSRGGSARTSTPSPAASAAAPDATAEGDTITIVAAGDIACDPSSGSFNAGNGTSTNCRQKYTAEAVEEINPDYVLGLGDMQYEEGFLDSYTQSYDRSWGRFKDKTFTVAGGSHDFYGGGDFYAYWGDRAGAGPSKNWFSLDTGGWHVVFLNSYCDKVGGCEPGSEQYEWLQADLASNAQPCTMALWHEPRYSSGPRHGDEEDVDPLWDLLYDHGADLLLTAHDHNYQRFAPMDAQGERDDVRGLRQFVVGTGGKSLDPVEEDEARPNSEVGQGHTYGVLALMLQPDGYSWEFVPEAGETFTDKGSGVCHKGAGDERTGFIIRWTDTPSAHPARQGLEGGPGRTPIVSLAISEARISLWFGFPSGARHVRAASGDTRPDNVRDRAPPLSTSIPFLR